MKNKKIIIGIGIVFVVSIIVIILIKENNEKAIAVVNNEKILFEKYELAKDEYVEFSEQELLEALILEKLVLQKATEYNIVVTSGELGEMLEQVKQMGDVINKKIIDKYKNMDNYSEALKNKITYTKVRDIIKREFCEKLDFNEESVSKDLESYIKENALNELSNEEIENLKKQLLSNYYNSLFNVQFEIWKYSLLADADIEVKKGFRFPNLISHFNSERATEINFEDIPDFYNVYFFMNSEKIVNEYDIDTLNTIPITNYYDRYLFIELNNKKDERKIELTFDIDVGKKQNLITNNENPIQIRGMNGYIKKYESDENKNIVELNIFDNVMNASIILKGYNITEEEILEFANEFIRISYN